MPRLARVTSLLIVPVLGLGATLLQSRETLNTELIMALMIIIGLLGVLTDWPMLLVMRKVFRMDVR